MAKGINKVILIGNLGADPEVRYTPNQLPVSNLSVATTEVWRDKQSGDLQERTEWHRVVFFGRQAEVAREYLKKGAKVYVEGSLRTRKWADKNGVERYTTEIVGSDMQMLDGRRGAGEGADYPSRSGAGRATAPFGEPAGASAPASGYASPATSGAPSAPASGTPASASLDEDIPF